MTSVSCFRGRRPHGDLVKRKRLQVYSCMAMSGIPRKRMVLVLAKCSQSCHADGWLACLVFPTYIIRSDQPSLDCEASSSSSSNSNSKKEGCRSSSSSELSMYITSRCKAKLGARRIVYFRHCEGDSMDVM